MRHVLRDHGYLFIDHRASPGISEEFARQAGYDPAFCREGKVMDTKTLRCAHCSVHVVPNPQRPNNDRATCPKCDHHYICDFCAFQMTQPDYVHTPYEKKVDLVLSGQPLGTPTKLITGA